MSNVPFVALFSGQGAQKPGMGADVQDIPTVADTYACASDTFGFDVCAMSQGSAEALNTTTNAQAALVTLSVALTSVLEEYALRPQAALGFSLGQVSALYATGMLDQEDTFRVAKARAEAMERATHAFPGAMCALIGADETAAQSLCERCAQEGVLVVANYNCPGQIVISGSSDAVDRAQRLWADEGGRAVILATAGAFHSPLMQQAADDLAAYLETVTFKEPGIPLICNTDASALGVHDVRERLVRHLTHPVYFQQSVEALCSTGSTCFMEIGFGGTLVAFLRKIDKTLQRGTIQDKATLTAFCSDSHNKAG